MRQFAQRSPLAIVGVALAFVLALLAMMIGSFGSGADNAYGAVGDITCIGASANLSFTPGVTNTVRTGTGIGSGSLGQCVSASRPTITGGSFAGTFTGQGSCVSGGSASGTGTVTYNNPGTPLVSTFSASGSIGFVLGIPTVTANGTITGGVFQGDTATILPLTVVFNPAACATPAGVQNATLSNALVTLF